MKLTVTLALLCTLFSAADGSSASSTYSGDRFANTQVALGSLFSLIYVVLSATCTYVLVFKSARRTGAFFTLLPTLSSQALSSIFGVFFSVINNGGLMSFSQSSYGPTYVAIIALNDFFSYWAYSGLFLCIYLLIHERHLAVKQVSIAIPAIYFALFALLIIFGITATSLSIDFNHLNLNAAGSSVFKVIHKALLANDLAYTFQSIWYFASACLIVYSIYVHKELKIFSINDSIMPSLLLVVIPLYTFLNIENLIFTIINSPAGIKYNIGTVSGRNQLEGVQVAATVLANVSFISVCIAILSLGFSGSRWNTEESGGSAPLTRNDSVEKN